MTLRKIELSEPDLTDRERANLLDAFDSTWISSNGKYISQFEQRVAELAGTKHAVVTNNGTTALHLTLVAAGIGPGDEVIIPAVTYVSVANVVHYVGATPVLVDVLPGTLGINADLVKHAVTPRTRAIIAVHLYGIPVDLQRLSFIARTHNLVLIEDCAEAHGAMVVIDGVEKPVGSIGAMGMFSFFGNKIVTTGEGGAVTTNDDSLAATVRQLRGQGMDLTRRYWFPMVGFNYRMTNLAAAIGCAQLERMPDLMRVRRQLNERYEQRLADIAIDRAVDYAVDCAFDLAPGAIDAGSVPWLRNIFVAEGRRDDVMARLGEAGIDSRPVFIPLYDLPPYLDEQGAKKFPVTHNWSYRGISLPLHTKMTTEDVDYICETLAQTLTA